MIVSFCSFERVNGPSCSLFAFIPETGSIARGKLFPSKGLCHLITGCISGKAG
jgi:hypothetical protein